MSDSFVINNSQALKEPVFIYNNWSSYDELSDNIFLTESLAIKELQEVLRIKEAGLK